MIVTTRRTLQRWLLLGAIGLTGLAGCQCGKSPGIDPVDAGADAGVDAGVDAGADAGLQVLEVRPNSAALVVAIPGAPGAETFKALLDGVDVSEQVAWSVSQGAIATVSGGLVSATGQRGGAVQITATLGDRSVSAELTVRLEVLQDPDGLKDAFVEGTEPESQLRFDYPYEGVVVPRNLQPLEVQWTAPAASDVLRLTWSERYVTVVQYLPGPAVGDATLAPAHWRRLADSGAGAEGDPVTLSLARPGFTSISQTLHIAQGDLPGSIVSDRSASSLEVLRQSVEDPAPSPRFLGEGCFGCHATSRDGRRAAFSYDGSLPFPVRVVDLAEDPPAFIPSFGASTVAGGTFSTFSPLGDRLVVAKDVSSSAASTLELFDLATATKLNANLMGRVCSEPEWSPDGAQLAAICGLSTTQGWAFDSSGGELVLGTWSTEDAATLSAIETLVADADVPGRPSYPSWSSDSRALAFSATTAGSRSTGDGTLYVVAREGGAPIVLAQAASGAQAFYPSFAPVRAGGYHWIAFTRRARFGHKLAPDERGVWVAALDLATGGSDPSRPPFFLQGQRGGPSSAVRFTRDACRDDAAACQVGIDCCSGTCLEGTCGPAGAGACVADTNACTGDAACCVEGSSCDDGHCVAPFPR